jgi:hypothetical protein
MNGTGVVPISQVDRKEVEKHNMCYSPSIVRKQQLNLGSYYGLDLYFRWRIQMHDWFVDYCS